MIPANRSNLLAAIRQGTSLVKVANPDEGKKDKAPTKPGGILGDLFGVLNRRRKKMVADSDSESSEESSDEDW